MTLFSHELTHLLLSLLVGFLVWKKFNKNIFVFVAALMGGFFIDLDHLFDYFMAFGLNFNLSYFFKGYSFLKTDKIYVLLHSWELVLLFFLLAFYFKNFTWPSEAHERRRQTLRLIILAFSLSLFLHLSADVLVDHMKIQSYSLVYRISNNFELKTMVTPSHYHDHMLRKKISPYR